MVPSILPLRGESLVFVKENLDRKKMIVGHIRTMKI